MDENIIKDIKSVIEALEVERDIIVCETKKYSSEAERLKSQVGKKSILLGNVKKDGCEQIGLLKRAESLKEQIEKLRSINFYLSRYVYQVC